MKYILILISFLFVLTCTAQTKRLIYEDGSTAGIVEESALKVSMNNLLNIPTVNQILYSNGTNLVSSANFTWNGSTLNVTGTGAFTGTVSGANAASAGQFTTLSQLQGAVSGTNNYIPKFTGTNSIANSSMIQDANGMLYFGNNAIYSGNPFGGIQFKHDLINNILYTADKRFTVTNTAGGSTAAAFDMNYENIVVFNANRTDTVSIAFSPSATYSAGQIAVSFYYTYTPSNIQVEALINGTWRQITMNNIATQNTIVYHANNRMFVGEMYNDIYMTNLRIILTTSGSAAWLTEIALYQKRTGQYEPPVFSKYVNNTSYTNLNFKSGSVLTVESGASLVVPNSIISTNALNVATGDVRYLGIAATAANTTLLNSQAASFYTNATNINAGTLPDARLSSNVPLNNANNVFLGTNTFSSNLIIKDPINSKNVNAYSRYVSFQDVANAEIGWFGYGSTDNNDFTFYNSAGSTKFYGGGVEGFRIETSGNTNMLGNKITNVGNGTASADAVNLSQLQSSVSGTTNYIPKFTGTNTIGNGLLQDDGSTLKIGNNFSNAGIPARLSINGGHANSKMDIWYDGAGTPNNEAYLTLWASEPANSYGATGIGSNIIPHNGTAIFQRKNTNIAGGYIRFNGGEQSFVNISAGGAVTTPLILSGANAIFGGTVTAADATAATHLVNRQTGDVRYLGIGATSANSTLLDGQSASYYTNATNINAGTLADARLSSNISLKNVDNNFSVNQTIPNASANGHALNRITADGRFLGLTATATNSNALRGLDTNVIAQRNAVQVFTQKNTFQAQTVFSGAIYTDSAPDHSPYVDGTDRIYVMKGDGQLRSKTLQDLITDISANDTFALTGNTGAVFNLSSAAVTTVDLGLYTATMGSNNVLEFRLASGNPFFDNQQITITASGQIICGQGSKIRLADNSGTMLVQACNDQLSTLTEAYELADNPLRNFSITFQYSKKRNLWRVVNFKNWGDL